MPQPIKPVHMLEQHSEIFDYADAFEGGLSSLQSMLLGVDGKPTNREAAKKYPSDVISMLEAVYNSPDELVTAASAIYASEDQKSVPQVFRVPKAISDHELLGLKTQGLITGNGRAVKFTQTGQVALRDHWLTTSNSLKENRSKSKFDYAKAVNTPRGEEIVRNQRRSSNQSKFRRVKGTDAE